MDWTKKDGRKQVGRKLGARLNKYRSYSYAFDIYDTSSVGTGNFSPVERSALIVE